ncbi:hypothetical protein D9M72_444980 [compost metagenome]
MIPLEPSAGVTVIESPFTAGAPAAEPVSTVAEMILSGFSSKGLKSLARTLMVSVRPALALSMTSSLAAGSGLLEATTVAVTAAFTAPERPSVTLSGMIPLRPAAMPESALTLSVWPSTVALKPSGSVPSSSKVSFSWSPSSTSFARLPSSRLAVSASGTSRSVPLNVGSWLALGSGITRVMTVSVDFSPCGSSGPEPSVTSNVTEPGPT